MIPLQILLEFRFHGIQVADHTDDEKLAVSRSAIGKGSTYPADARVAL